MITEDYVSFETALLLKEKGFDEKCPCSYRKKLINNKIVDEEELFVSAHLMLTNSELENKPYSHIVYCSAPTLQMAMKWLREKYNLYIEVNLTFSENPEKYHPRYYVYVLETKSGNSLIHKAATIEELNPLAHKNGVPKHFNTYEEACEAAIKYCLENLI